MLRRSASAECARLSVMPVELPFRFEDQPLVWTIPNVYSRSECAEIIQMIERSAPTPATNNPLHRCRSLLRTQVMTRSGGPSSYERRAIAADFVRNGSPVLRRSHQTSIPCSVAEVLRLLGNDRWTVHTSEARCSSSDTSRSPARDDDLRDHDIDHPRQCHEQVSDYSTRLAADQHPWQ